MNSKRRLMLAGGAAAAGFGLAAMAMMGWPPAVASPRVTSPNPKTAGALVHREIKRDVSPAPRKLDLPARAGTDADFSRSSAQGQAGPAQPEAPKIPAEAARIEQTAAGTRETVPLVESFDGLGADLSAAQSGPPYRNPSDNSLAAGPDHIVQIVNSRFAIFSKKGKRYAKSGELLYGPAPTNTIFAGFGGVCQARDNGDAVVRYDQIAGRWLFVMPIFSRIAPGEFPETPIANPVAAPGNLAKTGQASAPGPATALPAKPPEFQPFRFRGPRPRPRVPTAPPPGTYAMCYAVSFGSDPMGPYYRYAFERTLFPDYPRPAIWPDGYYVPTSTGDTVIQKHDCIAERDKMLRGLPAREQCVIIDGVNFLNNADIDGRKLPPRGAPNIMMAAGGTQLKKIFEDNAIYYWKVHVDWNTPANTKAEGPFKISVAPYHYLCNGQLTNCVPQPGTDRRLDAQGDKLMQRLVYRRIGRRQLIVAAHSLDTSAGGGGVRWYQFQLDQSGDPTLVQQGTYAPGGFYRWMPSIAMDKRGDIGVGYSFGGTPNFAGQRFAARLAKDPAGLLTFREAVLADGKAAQTNTNRWEDYTTTAMDPSDDCTFWYVGDYLAPGENGYRTKIGAFRLPGCK